MENKKFYSNLALFIVAIIWGSGFIILKKSLSYISPFYLLSYRFLIAALAMGLIFFKKLKDITLEDLKVGTFLGIIMFLGFSTQTVAMKYTSPGKQAFLLASNVAMVPFVNWALTHRKPDRFEFIGAFLCITGIGILTLDSGLNFGYGEIMSFISAIFFAFQAPFIGKYTKDHSPIILTIIQLFIAGAIALLVAFIYEGEFVYLSSETFLPLTYLALFATLIPYLVQNIAQRYTSPTSTAMILSLEAVFGTIMSVIFLKENITFRMLTSFIFVSIAIITIETKFNFIKSPVKDIYYPEHDLE